MSARSVDVLFIHPVLLLIDTWVPLTSLYNVRVGVVKPPLSEGPNPRIMIVFGFGFGVLTPVPISKPRIRTLLPSLGSTMPRTEKFGTARGGVGPGPPENCNCCITNFGGF